MLSYSANGLEFNELSPNSSKFSSISGIVNDIPVDVVFSTGYNKGMKFEQEVFTELKNIVEHNVLSDCKYSLLLYKLNENHQLFDINSIQTVEQRIGSTKKQNKDLDQLGDVIGDIFITSNQIRFPISLKARNGDTFASYSGGSSLFKDQKINSQSILVPILNEFGVDLKHYQSQFDLRNNVSNQYVNDNNTKTCRTEFFRHCWGKNYFYSRETRDGWEVFWIDDDKLDQLSSNITVDEIRYPNESSKQLSIHCSNQYKRYVIEVRNSSGGEYPNDVKVRVR